MIQYQTGGGVARITLNRPEKRNALNEEAISEISYAIAQSGQDPEVRVVLIAGAGQDFCSGMDIAMLDKNSDAGVLDYMDSAKKLADVFLALRRHPRPVVAAVRGRALGGGCGLATACDVVLAGESSQFGYPEVNIGFVPAIVMTLLRRSVSEKRAFDLLTSGEPVGAREAHHVGLISRVYPDTEFEAGVEAYLHSIIQKPASAIRLAKDLLYQIDAMPFEASLQAGVQVNAISRLTEDARQGFQKFTKKK